MKIAHILPYSITYPLSAPNGRHHWVEQLAAIQAANGHDVTVYCNPSSQLTGIRIAGITDATDDKRHNNIATFRLAFAGDHEIYHSHFDDLHYELATETARPIVATQHWWPSEQTIALAQTNPGNVWAVPPTQYMYDFDVSVGILSRGHIYHGIDLTIFRDASTGKNGRLLYVGRISPEKNLDMVIDIAHAAGKGLDIIGKITDKNADLWEHLQARIDGVQIRYLGTKTQQELVSYYAAASALIFPSSINEAFGLVAIEAQACGTPVLMTRGGSRGELIVEGTTGYLCESVDDFVAAVSKVDTLRAEDCITFANRFAIDDMATHYQDLYQELMSA